MDCIVHEVAKSQTQLSDFFTFMTNGASQVVLVIKNQPVIQETLV